MIERLILPGALSDRTVYDAAQATAFDALATQVSRDRNIHVWHY
jgi:hypothetical protein